MILSSIAFLLVCLAAAKWVHGAWVSPLSIYAAIWSSVLVAYHLRAFPFFDPLPAASLAFALAWLLFSVGCAAVVLLPVRRSVAPAASSSSGLSAAVQRAAMWMGLGFAVAIALAHIGRYGLSEMLAYGAAVRSDIVAPETNAALRYLKLAIAYAGMPSAYLGLALALAAYSSGRGKVTEILLSATSLLVYDFAYLSRGNAWRLLVFLAGAYLLARARASMGTSSRQVVVRVRRLFVSFGVVSVIFACLVLAVRIGGRAAPEPARVVVFERFPIPVLVAHPLGYLIGPLAGFNEALRAEKDDEHKLWYGRNSLSAVESLLRTLKLVRSPTYPPSLDHYQDMLATGPASSQNTYTYLRYFWDDFGWLGIGLGAAVFGFMVSLAWRYAAAKPAELAVSAGAIILVGSIPTSLMMWDLWNFHILAPLLSCAVLARLDRRRLTPARHSAVAGGRGPWRQHAAKSPSTVHSAWDPTGGKGRRR